MTFQIGQKFTAQEGYPPEAAVWCNGNNAYIEELSDGSFEIKAIPAPSLDALKLQKKLELESSFLEYRASKTTFVVSSLGFKANANSTAYMDVDGLIGVLTTQDEKSKSSNTATFMDFDNQPHDLTKEQLTTLKNEISQNGSRAYGVKWEYRQKIEAAKDKAALDAIVFDFNP